MWDFLAKYWKEIALAALLFAVCFFWWQDHNALVRAYDASVESYEVRIRELSESYQRETEKKQEVLEEYKERLAELEAEYEEYKTTVEEQKAQRVGELVVLRQEDPEQLVSEIEQLFGFEYVE